MLYTFRCVPGAIAPKLPIVFGLLHKIKHEILWAVVHCSSSKKHDDWATDKFWRRFCHFPELLASHHALSSMVLRFSSLIYAYYDDIMALSLDALDAEFKKVEALPDFLDGSVRCLVSAMMAKLRQFRADPDSGSKQYSHIRLDCYRIQYHVSVVSVHCAERERVDEFLIALKTLCDESRFAESIDTELKTLWYYPVSLQALFDVLMSQKTVAKEDELVALKFGVAASRNISRHWNVFLRICESVLQNVHHEFWRRAKGPRPLGHQKGRALYARRRRSGRTYKSGHVAAMFARARNRVLFRSEKPAESARKPLFNGVEQIGVVKHGLVKDHELVDLGKAAHHID